MMVLVEVSSEVGELSMQAQRSVNGVQVFLRDVLVNVLANLIAAAAIYLVGVMVGIFPRSPYLIVAAIFIGISYASLFAYVIYSSYSHFLARRKADIRVLSWCIILFGVGAVPAPFAIAEQSSLIDKICYPVMGIGIIAVGCLNLIERRRRSVKKTEPHDN